LDLVLPLKVLIKFAEPIFLRLATSFLRDLTLLPHIELLELSLDPQFLLVVLALDPGLFSLLLLPFGFDLLAEVQLVLLALLLSQLAG